MNIFSSFLPANKCTAVEDYIPFRHTKFYLQQRLDAFNTSPEDKTPKERLKELAQALGYADHSFQKFMVRWEKWQRLEGKVPVKYFEAIGVQPEVLGFVQALDLEEFEYALSLPVYPNNFIVRLMAAIYLPISLPEGTSEAEAIEIIREYQEVRKLRCCIKIRNLKTIYIEPQQGIHKITYPPILKKEGGFYSAGASGFAVGVTKVK
jgi:hypothetical protein